ncbi:MAG: low molecular weight phosphotyrosine protein phosphatase, partial [Thauera sp.]|nr:low molecular weight phosphotyrosine protein phosphatase [Thauera sp.]
MFDKILTLCTGNICRSPLAEFLLRDRLAARGRAATVASAGIGALVGHPADETTQRVALRHGIDLSPHVARQLTPEIT